MGTYFQPGERVTFDSMDTFFTGTVRYESERTGNVMVDLDEEYTDDGVTSGYCNPDYLTSNLA